ncbi:class I SAM-dependent methyltransferase [Sphingomonas sp. 10B4]|uniref:class I SAM-dependent methyltransferase n=1 Tax=Sphingomonas sp. 10B4 TaxID=3048575 RepID=UPI002AB51A39|nr:class I SAM-dependent methyltransferase [Sphingomonas sp. 10B4]MDY7523902.1 class I SAM-dependent methyltransferase [Sphingomonas sp. 10B4]MEB0284607.1 class I SAM-dependent methyltransferase [Sphingomonas sp. 10B4]
MPIMRRGRKRIRRLVPAVLEKLIDEQRVLCPVDRIPLFFDKEIVSSGRSNWRIKNRSLDLYGRYNGEPIVPDIHFSRKVAQSLGFGEEALQLVASAVADTSLIAGESSYTAEIADLADRLGLHCEPETAPETPVIDNLSAKVSFVGAYVGPTMPVGTNLTRSVRIRNDGPAAINSSGENAVYISYHWLDTKGKVVHFEGLRSPLPVDLLPGNSVTVICDIRTPRQGGNYQIIFQLVIEGVRWLEESCLTIPVTLNNIDTTSTLFNYTDHDASYADDHKVGLAMVENQLATISGKKRVLEVGGGIHPQCHILRDSDIVSIDISSPLSQLGQLYFDHVLPHDRIAFIACDAHEPPFAEETFDAITIFSALHHFADPVRLPANLRKVLKKGGFIATLCEPCKPQRYDVDYLRV